MTLVGATTARPVAVWIKGRVGGRTAMGPRLRSVQDHMKLFATPGAGENDFLETSRGPRLPAGRRGVDEDILPAVRALTRQEEVPLLTPGRTVKPRSPSPSLPEFDQFPDDGAEELDYLFQHSALRPPRFQLQPLDQT